MKKLFKVGLVVADISEYEPVAAWCMANGGVKRTVLNRDAVVVNLSGKLRTVGLTAVCCGVGKVNAATAAAYLSAKRGAELVVNAGLSGALSGSPIGRTVIGSGFMEYDFDLTPLGYSPAQKPRQKYIYNADTRYVNDLIKYFSCGAAFCVTGDRFVSDADDAAALVRNFRADCCDMETAAIASVCNDFNIPFACIRRISDSATDKSRDEYSSAIESKQTWMERPLEWIRSLADRTVV